MSESTEYPSIRVLDLALFLKSRIEVIDLYQSKEFIQTFKGTKMTLMNFLTKYSRPETVLDEKFFKTFVTKTLHVMPSSYYVNLNCSVK